MKNLSNSKIIFLSLIFFEEGELQLSHFCINKIEKYKKKESINVGCSGVDQNLFAETIVSSKNIFFYRSALEKYTLEYILQKKVILKCFLSIISAMAKNQSNLLELENFYRIYYGADFKAAFDANAQHYEYEVLKKLQDNFKNCDMKFVAFFAATHSPFWQKCMVPFPSHYDKQETAHLSLIDTMLDMISLEFLQSILQAERDTKLITEELMPVLHWLFCVQKCPELCEIAFERFENMMRQREAPLRVDKKPAIVFRVHETNDFDGSCFKDKHEIAYCCFHLEVLFSVLYNGLQHYVGEKHPLIMTFDFNECLHHAPLCAGWANSCIAPMMQCVMLCEFKDCCDTAPNKMQLSNDSKNLLIYDGALVRPLFIIIYAHPIKEYASIADVQLSPSGKALSARPRMC